jgi:hypothetical protein
VDWAPADLPQNFLLRRTENPHTVPRWDSDASHKCLITEKSDILKRGG